MSLHQTFRLLPFLLVGALQAQSIRDHTRLGPSTGTAVTQSQAVDLTLTVTEVSVRPVQTWIRTAGTLDKSGKTLNAVLYPPEASLIKVGQRVRAFPPEARSSMSQARVTRVTNQGNRVVMEAELLGSGRENSAHYVMEIIAEHGQFLSVPNEAIIEEGEKHVVYVQHEPGKYMPHEIRTGIQGELYTQVLHGVTEGLQVVTFGSFFIDSEFKLKSGGSSSGNVQHHH